VLGEGVGIGVILKESEGKSIIVNKIPFNEQR